MALERVWYGAKYSHRVWERFAHTFEESDFSPKMFALIHDLYANVLFQNLCFILCLKQSATGKMTVLTVGSFHGVHETVTLTWYLLVRHVSPTFWILCIIDVFLFVQHIGVYVFYIYIYICTYIWTSMSASLVRSSRRPQAFFFPAQMTLLGFYDM